MAEFLQVTAIDDSNASGRPKRRRAKPFVLETLVDGTWQLGRVVVFVRKGWRSELNTPENSNSGSNPPKLQSIPWMLSSNLKGERY
jgi:hypothetical protein